MKGKVIVIIIALAMALGPLTTQDQTGPDRAVQSVVETEPTVPTEIQATEMLSNMRMEGSFLENLGQLDDDRILFYALGEPLTVGLARDRVVFTLVDVGPDTSKSGAIRFEMILKGCNDVIPQGNHALGHPTNFFIGNDPDRWVRDARSYHEVLYEDLYDGVDLRFYFRDGMFKYDFILTEGADPGVIRCSYDGIEGLEVDARTGELIIRTGLGDIRDSRPSILHLDGEKEKVDAEYRLLDERSWGYTIPTTSLHRSMVVDPGIHFSTFLGGYRSKVHCVAPDTEGNIVVAGSTTNSSHPTTPGTIGSSCAGESAFLVKLDPDGEQALFYTYFGGTDGSTLPQTIAFRDDGNILISGETSSSTFPISLDANQKDNGGGSDVFILLVNPDASQIIYGSYFGGSGDDIDTAWTLFNDGYMMDSHLDDDGSFYISSQTRSDDLPVTGGAFCTTGYPQNDLYLVKFDSTLKNIVFCTYFGSPDERPYWWFGPCWWSHVTDICVDEQHDIYIIGETYGQNFTTTPGAYLTNFTFPVGEVANYGEIFLMRVDSTGSRLEFSTFLTQGWGQFVHVMDNGSILVAGVAAVGLPTGPHSLRDPIRDTDHFYAIIDADGTRFEYASYIGVFDEGLPDYQFINLDEDRSILYFYGYCSYNSKLNTTEKCMFNETFNERYTYDYFIIGVDISDPTRPGISYCSLITASARDWLWYIYPTNQIFAIDGNGTLLLGGYTESPDFPITNGAFCSTFFGGTQWGMGFVMRVDPVPCTRPGNITGISTFPSNYEVTINWDPTRYSQGKLYHYTVYRSKSTNPETAEPIAAIDWPDIGYTDENVTNGETYYYWVTITAAGGESLMGKWVESTPTGPPTEPQNLTVESGHRFVNLSWNPPMNSGGLPLDAYLIYWGESPEDLHLLAIVKEGTSFQHDVSTFDKEFYYKVTAINTEGESFRSNLANITPWGPPSEPTGFNFTERNQSVNLTWFPPKYYGGSMYTEYVVYRGDTEDDLQPIGNSSIDDLYYLDEGLENGRTYYYKVCLDSNYGEGDSTRVLAASPFTEPSAPREFTIVAERSQAVELTWSEPDDDGGRPIIGYVVYYKLGDGPTIETDPISGTSYVVDGLTNDEVYYFSVAAKTTGALGLMCAPILGVPGDPPGMVTDLAALATDDGVMLTWDSPENPGSSPIISYRVMRGVRPDSMDPIAELTEELEYPDASAEEGLAYYYSVVTFSKYGDGPAPEAMKVMRPGKVATPSVLPGDGVVMITWAAPDILGSSAIVQYIIERGTSMENMVRIARVDSELPYTDDNVTNGVDYYYAIRAVNSEGEGPRSSAASAKPMPVPGAPTDIKLSQEGTALVLKWDAPDKPNCAAVTGYTIKRGTSSGNMVEIADLGVMYKYTDNDVEEGKTYYYSVIAQSHVGDGEEPSAKEKEVEGTSNMGLYLLLLLVVIVALVLAVAYVRKGKGVTEVAAAPVAAVKEHQYLVEQVFVVYEDGRLVSSCTREDCAISDPDLMSSMLIAIQGVMQDGLQRGSLESIRYGDSLIMMSAGRHVNVAAVLYGEPEDTFKEDLESSVSRIETSYAGVIEDWSGDQSDLLGIDGLARGLLESTAGVTRESVSGAKVSREVSVLSAVDRYREFYRLKVAAVNDTDETITDVSIGVSFDGEALRLDRVEPHTLELEGDSVELGNIKSGERKTASFLFEPTTAGDVQIEGELLYTDPEGEEHTLEMKRRSIGG